MSQRLNRFYFLKSKCSCVHTRQTFDSPYQIHYVKIYIHTLATDVTYIYIRYYINYTKSYTNNFFSWKIKASWITFTTLTWSFSWGPKFDCIFFSLQSLHFPFPQITFLSKWVIICMHEKKTLCNVNSIGVQNVLP